MSNIKTGIKSGMRRFHLLRQTDVSGMSGTGTVVEGTMFSDGTCVIRWLTKYSSIAIYSSVKDLIAIHGHYDEARGEFMTDIEWDDPE